MVDPVQRINALQERVAVSFTYRAPDAVPTIADALNVSRAEVHGVITYYPHFRQQPAGRHVVQVCQAEACKACGADTLMARAQEVLGSALNRAATFRLGLMLAEMLRTAGRAVDGSQAGAVSPAEGS